MPIKTFRTKQNEPTKKKKATTKRTQCKQRNSCIFNGSVYFEDLFLAIWSSFPISRHFNQVESALKFGMLKRVVILQKTQKKITKQNRMLSKSKRVSMSSKRKYQDAFSISYCIVVFFFYVTPLPKLKYNGFDDDDGGGSDSEWVWNDLKQKWW